MLDINFRLLALVLVFPWFVGCASLNTGNMVVDETSFGTQYPATVAVKTIGGSPSVKWYSDTITPEEFQKAVSLSLEKSTLFKAVVNEDAADYLLTSDLAFAGSHPGASMTAWIIVKWDLVERLSGNVVWSDKIETEGHVGAFDAFSGSKRQYMALERGAKANINQALIHIRALDLVTR